MTTIRGWTIALIVSLVVLMIILFAVCSGDDSGDTTTTSAATSTTAPEVTTTTVESTTTSIPEAATTTVAETTTTVDDGLLEGNWAPEPLVVADYGALGWWDGAGWVQVEPETALPVSGGEDYQIARFGVEGITVGGAETETCEVTLGRGVPLEDGDLLGSYPDPVGVAISAAWPLNPHLVEQIEDDGTLATVAAGLLADSGIEVVAPPIKQAFRFDLEGDGVNEVVAVAEDIGSDLFAEVGEYSIVFMQRVAGGSVGTSTIVESVVAEPIPEGEVAFMESFAVGAIADMNGDGRVEFVISAAYYEGIGIGVWEHVSDELGALQQISTGCGS